MTAGDDPLVSLVPGALRASTRPVPRPRRLRDGHLRIHAFRGSSGDRHRSRRPRRHRGRPHRRLRRRDGGGRAGHRRIRPTVAAPLGPSLLPRPVRGRAHHGRADVVVRSSPGGAGRRRVRQRRFPGGRAHDGRHGGRPGTTWARGGSAAVGDDGGDGRRRARGSRGGRPSRLAIDLPGGRRAVPSACRGDRGRFFDVARRGRATPAAPRRVPRSAQPGRPEAARSRGPRQRRNLRVPRLPCGRGRRRRGPTRGLDALRAHALRSGGFRGHPAQRSVRGLRAPSAASRSAARSS